MAKRSYSLFELFAIFSIFNWLFGGKRVVIRKSRKLSKDDAKGCCGCLIVFLIIAGLGALFMPMSDSSPKKQRKTEEEKTVRQEDISQEGEAAVEESPLSSSEDVPQAIVESEGPSLRVLIMEEREIFKELIAAEAQAQNKLPVWSEDLYFQIDINSLCGLDLGQDITRCFSQPSFLFKTETFRLVADGLLAVDFESSVNCLDSTVKTVIVDENLAVHGICVSWPMASQKEIAYKFADVRVKLTRLLKLSRRHIDTEEFLQYFATYTFAKDDNRVIVLKTDNDGLELMLLATTKPISIYAQDNQNDIQDNPIAQKFSEALERKISESLQPYQSNETDK